VIFADALVKLGHELRLLGARNFVVTFNEIRSPADDPGISVYFSLGKKPLSMACDRYTTQGANCRSLSHAVNAMRQLARHGGAAMMDRAFEGFATLPSPKSAAKRSWRDVLGLSDGVRIDAEVIEQRYRSLAKEFHPDAGGSHESMLALNVAREQALREIEGT
jgi:hypothetical protein